MEYAYTVTMYSIIIYNNAMRANYMYIYYIITFSIIYNIYYIPYYI